MKDETKSAVDNLIAGAMLTAFVMGPFSLCFIPSAVREYKAAKERRLTREAQEAIDAQVELAKEQADAQKREMLALARGREADLMRRQKIQAWERAKREAELTRMRVAVANAERSATDEDIAAFRKQKDAEYYGK
jgi:hypothetical protein